MSIKSAEIYRTSDYPNFPDIMVCATRPVDPEELRAAVIELNDVDFAGKQATFNIYTEDADTGKITHMIRIDPSTDLHEFDFSSIV